MLSCIQRIIVSRIDRRKSSINLQEQMAQFPTTLNVNQYFIRVSSSSCGSSKIFMSGMLYVPSLTHYVTAIKHNCIVKLFNLVKDDVKELCIKPERNQIFHHTPCNKILHLCCTIAKFPRQSFNNFH